MTRKQFWRGISRATFDSDFIATRITLALAEITWAVMLFWPGDTFARPTYSLMAILSHELVWAFAFLFSGIAQFSIAVTNSCNTPQAHIFGAWNASLWLVTVGAMLLSVYPPPAAIGGEVALAFASVWIAVRPLILSNIHKKFHKLVRSEGLNAG